MKQGVLIACLGLLLFSGAGHVVTAAPDTATRDKESGAVTAPAAQSRDVSDQPEGSFEAWAHKTAGPWMARVTLGTIRYARYLMDKSGWVNFVLFSRYLETSDCFYRDLEWAAEIYREGAKAGREAPALYLGYLYLKGLGVERDVKKARRWFDLGVLYTITADKKYQIKHIKWIMGHRGMPPELMAAIERGRKKLEGDGAEIERIARWLRIGIQGVTQNEAAAAELLRIAKLAINRPPDPAEIENKFRHNKEILKNDFRTGDARKRRLEVKKAALELLWIALRWEHAPSEKLLAEFFESGKWVPKNVFFAFVLFSAAQSNGLDATHQLARIIHGLP